MTRPRQGRVVRPGVPGSPLVHRYGGRFLTAHECYGTVHVSDVPARRAEDGDVVAASEARGWTDEQWRAFAALADAWRMEHPRPAAPEPRGRSRR